MLVQCGGGVNPIIIHSVTSLFNGYIQSLVEVNQAIVAWLFTLTHRQKSSNKWMLDNSLIIVCEADLIS